MPDEFNPDSYTAVLATLIAQQAALRETMIARSDQQDTVLARIEAQTVKTNGRVTLLERWRDTTKARVAAIITVCGLLGGLVGWMVQTYLTVSTGQ